MSAPGQASAEPSRGRPRWWPSALLLGPAPLVLFAIVGALAVGLRKHEGTGIGSRPVLGIVVILALAALTLRRRQPVVVLAVVLALYVAIDFGPVTPLVLLALVAIALLRSRREAVIAGIVTALVLVATPAIHGHPLTHSGDIISRIVSIGLAVALGLYLRARQDYVWGLVDRAERLERERELLARQAVGDERVRIARELHDAVAHTVSLMIVQAQAIEAAGAEPHQSQALGRIADLGREAMSEMQRMLGVLRTDPTEAAERTPQPGVADLDALIEQVRDAGLDADLRVEGPAQPLAPGVDLSAYRIVQEALTNVIRHAKARSAAVTLRYTTTGLDLQIEDDGVGPPAGVNGSAGSGHGLVGMRERVALLGGELHAGAAPDGRGYLVHAVLPLR